MNPRVPLALLLMLEICSFQRSMWWMVTPRYLALSTSSRVCPWSMYPVFLGCRLLDTCFTLHFCGWNFTCHRCSQCWSADKSLCSSSASPLLDIFSCIAEHHLRTTVPPTWYVQAGDWYRWGTRAVRALFPVATRRWRRLGWKMSHPDWRAASSLLGSLWSTARWSLGLHRNPACVASAGEVPYQTPWRSQAG